MRILFVSISAGLVGAAFAIAACGSTDTATDDPPDAAHDSSVREGSVLDASDAEPPCDPTKDLLGKVTDASIGDGASTTGLCVACVKAHCAEAIASCTADCPCQHIVSNALDCYLKTQQVTCAAALADYFVTATTRKYALEVFGCAQNECPTECVVEAGVVDTDAAVDGGGDGG